MRIGMVTGEYPPMNGGVGDYTRVLADALRAEGHEVVVFTRLAARSDDARVAAEVGGRWGWHTLRAIRDWVERERLDVVDVQFQTAAYDMHPAIHWLPAHLDTPTIVTFHDLREPYLLPKARGLRRGVMHRLSRSAAGAIATDPADANTLRAWGVERVAWIPIGSNVTTTLPEGYDRAAWRARLGVPTHAPLISYFGFLNASKGALTLLEALAELRQRGADAHAVMIGGREGASDPTDRAYGQQVDACIEALGLGGCVHWTGHVPDDAVSAHFAASDLTALPFRDGVSLRRGTLMAALTHGQPIVTTTPTAPLDVLRGAVVTVPPDDPAALADALAALWANESRRHALGTAAREAAAAFAWPKIARQTAEFAAQAAARTLSIR